MILSGAALEVARRIFDLREACILCLGHGPVMGAAVASFHAAHPRRLLTLDWPPEDLRHFDVVLCALGGPAPVIARTAVQRASRARRNRPMFLADLALPGDIEPAVGKLAHVFLYNLDDLQKLQEGSRR